METSGFFMPAQGGERVFGCLMSMAGCPFPSAHSLCPNAFILHHHLSPAKHCTLQEGNTWFIECVHHLLLLQYELGPPLLVP